MATENTVDLSQAFNATSALLEAAKNEYESKLEGIQDVIDQLSFYRLNTNTLAAEIGEITFQSYASIKNLIDRTSLQVTRESKLLETGIDKHIVHVFEADSLDLMEAKVVAMVSAAGSGEMKNLSGVALSDAMRSTLISGQDNYDGQIRNDAISLIGRYPTANTFGNTVWISEQLDRKAIDRGRNIYSTLFKLAQENVVWAYQQGIEIEKLHANFTARYNRLYLDMTAANIAAYKAEVRGNIAEFEAKLEEIAAQMMIEELKYSKDSTEWELRVQQYNARLQEYVKEYTGKISTNKDRMATRIIGGKNIADGYKSIYSAYSSQYSGVSLSNSTAEE